MPHEAVYCDVCRKNLATFSLLKNVDGKTMRRRLCRECAAREGSGQAWLQAIEEEVGGFPEDDSPLPEELSALINAELDIDPDNDPDDALFAEFDEDELAELLDELGPVLEELDAQGMLEEADELGSILEELNHSATPDGDTPGLLSHEESEHSLLPEVFSKRCPKCDTTWDRLKEDGRAGCAYCYESFEDNLLEVMGKMQREAQHIGKIPVARLKRRQRLEHLRKQRDNRLHMLKNRLKEAVAAENYEDAAALRDKIKMVESTIVDDR